METRGKFAEPTLEVVLFSEQDVVTTSGGNSVPGGGIVMPEIPME